jgi:hypothetical protein
VKRPQQLQLLLVKKVLKIIWSLISFRKYLLQFANCFSLRGRIVLNILGVVGDEDKVLFPVFFSFIDR